MASKSQARASMQQENVLHEQMLVETESALRVCDARWSALSVDMSDGNALRHCAEAGTALSEALRGLACTIAETDVSLQATANPMTNGGLLGRRLKAKAMQSRYAASLRAYDALVEGWHERQVLALMVSAAEGQPQ